MLARAWSDPKILKLAVLCGEPLVHIAGHLEAMRARAYEHLPRSGYIAQRFALPGSLGYVGRS